VQNSTAVFQLNISNKTSFCASISRQNAKPQNVACNYKIPQMTLTETEHLLNEFDNLPKTIRQPTYLEICKYPRRRFEEICSRLLCFYIAPKNEHGFGDLFLTSLLELLTSEKINFKDEHIKVISEENAEGKRLDILIHSTNFVIGIENKITATVYNPLETYKNRIDLYGNENIFRVVLSLKKIVDKNELAVLKANGFTRLTYFELFEVVKRKVGSYLNQANPKYLTFLTDFIQTLENMSGENVLNEKLADYFFDNSSRIDSLIDLYEKYSKRTLDVQVARIAELKEKISELTENNHWWVWEGWDLGYNNLETSKPKIGIEASFSETKGKALGNFKIYITTWTLKDWAFYEEQVLKKFPTSFLDKVDNRAYLHMDVIEDDNEELILDRLKQYFDYLITLTRDK